MRVLLLGAYPPPYGGLQTHIVGLRDFLIREGIPCEVINLTSQRRSNVDGIFYPSSALGVLWYLLRCGYDVAHLHVGGNLTFRWVVLASLCSWIPKKKVILTFHSGGYPSSPMGRAVKPCSFTGMTFRRLNGLIGVNVELVEFFRRLGVPAEKTRLIGPYAPGTQPAAELTEPLRKFFNSHWPVIVTVGLLEPEYDLSLQIRMLGGLRQNMPNAGLAIIGSGSLEAKLRAQIEVQPYRDNILLCGDVAHDVTLRAIAEADVLLRTTLYDGDSISVREGLNLGVPVIATNNGLRPEGVILVPVSDCRALLEAISISLCVPRSRRPQHVSDEVNLRTIVEFYNRDELLR